MKKFKSHFKFSKQERSGIFFLLLIIVFSQAGIIIYRSSQRQVSENSFELNVATQAKIDSLKQEALKKDSNKVFPFNPNYITDYKGYTLGLSIEEIDRLHAYRAQNLFVNSANEFQKITKVSDSLLHIISPYFKFPEWVTAQKITERRFDKPKTKNELASNKESIQAIDLNKTTADELKTINGIGDKLSQRIIKFRNRLGGFLVDEQLYDVYGLEPEVVKRTLSRFKVLSKPKVEKININIASIEEISSLIYLRYELGVKIIEYREVNGSFTSLDELTKIHDFPVDKIQRIKLYLTL